MYFRIISKLEESIEPESQETPTFIRRKYLGVR